MYAQVLILSSPVTEGVERSREWGPNEGPFMWKKHQEQRIYFCKLFLLCLPPKQSVQTIFLAHNCFLGCSKCINPHLTPPQAFQRQNEPALLMCAITESRASLSLFQYLDCEWNVEYVLLGTWQSQSFLQNVIQITCYYSYQFKIGSFCLQFAKYPVSLRFLSASLLPLKITNHVPSTVLGSFHALCPLIFTTAQ